MDLLRVALIAPLLLASGALAAEETVKRFNGYAWDLESGHYLYTEIYEQRFVDGQWLSGSTRYFGPDGQQIGIKTLDFSADPYVPVYRLDLAYGYSEGITQVGDPIVMVRRLTGSKPERSESEKREGLMAADAGMPKLLYRHFEDLLDGKVVEFRLLAPGRLSTYKFRARRIADASFEDRPVVQFEVELDSMFKLFAGPLRFAFDAESRDLREYRGTTNIRNPASGELYTVRVGYYSKPPKDVPPLN